MTSHARLIAEEMDAYVYQPLADGDIRLVELFSHTAPLVPFEALSYVWGP